MNVKLKVFCDRFYREDQKISLAIVVWLIVSALNASIKLYFTLPQSVWGLVSGIGGSCFYYALLRVCKIVIRRSGKVLCVTFFVLFFLYMKSVIQNIYELEAIKSYALWTFFFCLPIGICIYSVCDKKILYETLLKASYWIAGILSLIVFSPSTGDTHYNMFFSSSMILPLLLHLNEYIRRRKFFFLLLSLGEILLIVLYGSRGSLLCLGVFVILNLFYSIKSKVKQVLIIGLLFLFGCCYSIYKDQIGGAILNYLSSKNYYSRTLILLFQDEVTDLSGREVIWRKSNELLFEKPVLGWGVGGEIVPLSRASGHEDGESVTTTHNGWLELMLNHGIIVGLIIGLFFVLSIIRVRNIRDYYYRDLMFVFYSAFMTTTMTVGDGYLVKPGVWMYLFLFFASFKKERTRC